MTADKLLWLTDINALAGCLGTCDQPDGLPKAQTPSALFFSACLNAWTIQAQDRAYTLCWMLAMLAEQKGDQCMSLWLQYLRNQYDYRVEIDPLIPFSQCKNNRPVASNKQIRSL